MSIKVGDKVPSAKLRHMTAEGPKEVTTDELFGGKNQLIATLCIQAYVAAHQPYPPPLRA